MPNQVRISCSTTSSSFTFIRDSPGVYLIREFQHKLEPHDIPLPVIPKDVGEHRGDTGGKFGKYPMILNENGQERPIFEVKNPLEVFKAYFDAFLAHQRLWEETHILHKNICPNVILVNARGGFLVDWDHSPEFHNLARNFMSFIKPILIKPNDKLELMQKFHQYWTQTRTA